jgi:hypothetical protein
MCPYIYYIGTYRRWRCLLPLLEQVLHMSLNMQCHITLTPTHRHRTLVAHVCSRMLMHALNFFFWMTHLTLVMGEACGAAGWGYADPEVSL